MDQTAPPEFLKAFSSLLTLSEQDGVILARFLQFSTEISSTDYPALTEAMAAAIKSQDVAELPPEIKTCLESLCPHSNKEF